MQEYDVTVGMHASDDGLTRYFNQWQGHQDDYLPFADTTAFSTVQHLMSRGIFDAMLSAISHGMLSRFPGLRVLPVENGSSWVLPLINALGQAYAQQPRLFAGGPRRRPSSEHLDPPLLRRGPQLASSRPSALIELSSAPTFLTQRVLPTRSPMPRCSRACRKRTSKRSWAAIWPRR